MIDGPNDYKAILREAAEHDDFGYTKKKVASLERRLDALVGVALQAADALPADAPERTALHAALRSIRNGVGP